MKEEFDPIVCINEYGGKFINKHGVKGVVAVHPETGKPFVNINKFMLVIYQQTDYGFNYIMQEIESLSYPKPSRDEIVDEYENTDMTSSEFIERLKKHYG